MSEFIKKIANKMDNSATIRAVRTGLVMIIPVLMIGAFSLVLMSMPIDAYQDFIRTGYSAAYLKMLQFAYNSTYGMISVYIAFTVVYFYIKNMGIKHNYAIVGGITSVICFFVLSGISSSGIDIKTLGVRGMFVAIFCGIISSKIFVIIIKNIKIPFKLYADGIDLEFNDAIIAMIPTITVVILFVLFNYLVTSVGNVDSFHELYIDHLCMLVSNNNNNFATGFSYVVTATVLWFFGVHGTEVLSGVTDEIYTSSLARNIADKKLGNVPKEILTTSFFEHFVLIGGCGTAICLLIAMFIGSKRKINRNISKLTAIPIIFNANEILIFGYPVIYNPYMLAPFLVTPIMSYCVAYLAMYMKWVPVVTEEVEWTTPIIFSGYKATGSISGAILQLVIIFIGVIIYLPFVKLYDNSKRMSEIAVMDELTNILKKAEEEHEDIKILEVDGRPGALAKCLAVDIKNAIDANDIKLFYQLQYDNDYKCIGAEALLRYNHPIHGFIYPPLIIKLAEEYGILGDLERCLFVQGAQDNKTIKAVMGRSYKISVNITIATILEPEFLVFLGKLKEDYDIKDGEMCIEITEQMAIKSDAEFERVLNVVKQMGFLLAIDDFSMGSTSLKYLQKNHFDIVKLDGSIVKEMMINDRSKDIISSIVYLAKSLNFKVLAEYVESEEEIDKLRKVGCNYYQGYHFSKSVNLDEFISILEKDSDW